MEQTVKLPVKVEVVQIKLIGAETDWADALAGVDTVVHLAARVHVMNDTATDPLVAFRQVNVAGTERLARLAAINGVVCSRFFDGNIERRITEPNFFINLSSNKFKSLIGDTRREIKWKLSFLMRYCRLLTCLRMK